MSQFEEVYKARLHELETSQQGLRRKLSYLMGMECALILTGILCVISIYFLYREFGNIIHGLPLGTQLAIGCLAFTLPIIVLIMIVSVDCVRANTGHVLILSSVHYDIAAGVNEAVNAYLGDTLPEYREEMGNLGIGHELFRTVQLYSERMNRIRELTDRALEMLNIKGPLRDVKDLPAQARLIINRAQEIIDITEQLPKSAKTERLIKQLTDVLREEGIDIPKSKVRSLSSKSD